MRLQNSVFCPEENEDSRKKTNKMGNHKTNSGKGRYSANNKIRWLVVFSGWLLCVTGFVAGGLFVFRITGKYNLKIQAVNYVTEIEDSVQEDLMSHNKEENWKKGQTQYEEKDYSYNKDILTFLFMGIDREEDGSVSGGGIDGRQTGVLLLLVLDPHTKTMKLLHINCNIMAKIDVYDERGTCEGSIWAPICTQHQFGDGKQESCVYQVKAVQNLIYNIPVNGYLAVDMDAIPVIIDMVEEIDLKAVKDGNKQFLADYINKVKNMVQGDMTLPIKMYNAVSDRIITDITVDEVFYLATIVDGYHFDADQIFMIPERSVTSQDEEADEFYIDEDAFFKLILSIFYEPTGK